MRSDRAEQLLYNIGSAREGHLREISVKNIFIEHEVGSDFDTLTIRRTMGNSRLAKRRCACAGVRGERHAEHTETEDTTIETKVK
jgi:hypothetical protein